MVVYLSLFFILFSFLASGAVPARGVFRYWDRANEGQKSSSECCVIALKWIYVSLFKRLLVFYFSAIRIAKCLVI